MTETQPNTAAEVPTIIRSLQLKSQYLLTAKIFPTEK